LSWEGLGGGAVTAGPSALDSDRFGLSIGRVTVGWDASEDQADTLTEVLANAPEDILIVRWPTHLLGLGAAAAAAGRLVIPADTLTYWEVPAGHIGATASAAQLAKGLQCEAATDYRGDPRAAIAEIVRDSFRSYGNHYLANPALSPELALEGYVEWALRSLEQEPENVLLLTDEDRAVGMATVAEDSTGNDLEVLLAGIATDHQARGLYAHLFAAIDRSAVERSCRRVIISTQVHNVKVQRAWARLGLKPFAAISTVHAVRAERDGGPQDADAAEA
jgi:RimJ/RimL family protein N-acetyltransferase